MITKFLMFASNACHFWGGSWEGGLYIVMIMAIWRALLCIVAYSDIMSFKFDILIKHCPCK